MTNLTVFPEFHQRPNTLNCGEIRPSDWDSVGPLDSKPHGQPCLHRALRPECKLYDAWNGRNL